MIDSVIDSECCRTVAFSLFHTIWAGLLIGALALVMNRFRWRSATLQYQANGVALLLLVVCLFSAHWYSRNAVACSLRISRHPFDHSIKLSENNQTESPEGTNATPSPTHRTAISFQTIRLLLAKLRPVFRCDQAQSRLNAQTNFASCCSLLSHSHTCWVSGLCWRGWSLGSTEDGN